MGRLSTVKIGGSMRRYKVSYCHNFGSLQDLIDLCNKTNAEIVAMTESRDGYTVIYKQI